jgi:hypothetical protein
VNPAGYDPNYPFELGLAAGRNGFQRPKEHALKFLETIMKIYAGELA